MERGVLEHISALTNRVAELEDRLEFVLKAMNLEYQPSTAPRQYPAVEELIKKGRKLEAIQAYQLATGAGLSEARTAVDELERSLK